MKLENLPRELIKCIVEHMDMSTCLNFHRSNKYLFAMQWPIVCCFRFEDFYRALCHRKEAIVLSMLQLIITSKRALSDSLGTVQKQTQILNLAFEASCAGGLAHVVKFLVDHPKFVFEECDSRILQLVCHSGHQQVLDILVAHPTRLQHLNTEAALQSAATQGHLDILQKLLQTFHYETGAMETAVIHAWTVGQEESIAFLLSVLKDKEITIPRKDLKNIARK